MPEEQLGKVRIHRPVGWKCNDEDDVPTHTPSLLTAWHGDFIKDQITAEQWVERIQGARDVCKWSDDLTMYNAFNALKGKALSWYVILKRSNKESIRWVDFKATFLKQFSRDKNPLPIVKFNEICQQSEEKVIDFYNRVVKAIDDLESFVPNGSFDLPEPAFPRALTSVPGFANLNAKNKRNAAHRLVRHGASSAFNFMGLNLFIGGIRSPIQDELLKSRPKTLYSALEIAQTFEKCEAERKSRKVSATFQHKPIPKHTLVDAHEPEEPMECEEFVEDGDYDEDDDQSDYDNRSDNDDYLSDDSVTHRNMQEDIGLNDKQLMEISTKDLNKLLKKRKIDKDRQTELKSRRRTLKNRGYAASCRSRRDETEESIKKEIMDLNVKVADKVVKIETTRKDSKTYADQLMSFGMSEEMIDTIRNSEQEVISKLVMDFGSKQTSSQSFNFSETC